MSEPLTREQEAALRELVARLPGHVHTNLRNCLATLDAERAAVERLTRERDEARDRLRAFIGSVEEMTLGAGVNAGLVVIDPGSDKPRAVQNQVTREWFENIMQKWHRDEASLVGLYESYRRSAAERDALRREVDAARDFLDCDWMEGENLAVKGAAYRAIRAENEKREKENGPALPA